MHGADVVEHVVVTHDNACDHDKEVEAPHHLCEAPDAKVLGAVVVVEVAIACHPHIARYEHPNGVVCFGGLEVVVQQERHLQQCSDLVQNSPYMSRKY